MIKQILFIYGFAGLFAATFAQSPGNSLDFDGSNDQVTASLPAVFNNIGTTDITVEAWIKPKSSVFSRIFFAQQDGSNFFNISFSNSNEIYFYVVVGGTTYSIVTSSTLPLNQWSHIAVRWTAASQTPEVLFNGVLQAGGPGGSSSSGTNNMMTLGTRPGGAQYFNGEIDELRVWNTLIPVCDIAANRFAALTGSETNLITYYRFDEGIAGGTNAGVTNLPDLTTSFPGTLINFTLAGSASNWLASGATINVTGLQPSLTYDLKDTVNVCSGGSITHHDGTVQNNVTMPGTHLNNFISVQGCDSIIETTVLIAPAYDQADTAEVCLGESYTFPDGFVMDSITAPANHISALMSVYGCDSIVETTINVKTVNDSVSQAGGTLTAIAAGTYQWLYCDNNYAPVAGETGQSFTASVTGNYAVAITENGCTDTSACIFVMVTGLDEIPAEDRWKVYPNPFSDQLTVMTDFSYEWVKVEIRDVSGRIVFAAQYRQEKNIRFTLDAPAGMYFVTLQTEREQSVRKLVKE